MTTASNDSSSVPARFEDQDERIRLYREFERLWIGEEAAILPLAYDRWLLLSRPWIDGIWSTPLMRGMFDEVVECGRSYVRDGVGRTVGLRTAQAGAAFSCQIRLRPASVRSESTRSIVFECGALKLAEGVTRVIVVVLGNK